MINALTIQAKNSPEFLERLLRVCRHRGFIIQSINAEVNDTLQSTQINLTVCSERDISLLTKQIDKVVGVIGFTLLQQPENIKASA